MRVLIADDDSTSQRVLAAIASRDGHECLLARDGTVAWQVLSSEDVDVLLTDWMMPGLAGPELCRRVRGMVTARYVYIVLITGLGDPGQVLAGMEAGADDYLVKPVVPFAVRTRLVAAARVTALHRQVAEFRSQLEQVNAVLLGLSRTDPLTGLGNRRALEENLAAAQAHGRRVLRPYSLVLFDIDHFKLYNDRYGHPAGDEALRQVAWCISAAARADETAYRYGGEEFVLLLADCDAQRAVVAAERLCGAVAATAMPHETRPSAPQIVTLSAGVSSWNPGSQLDQADVLERADRALYEAKVAGRNRVHIAAEEAAGARRVSAPI